MSASQPTLQQPEIPFTEMFQASSEYRIVVELISSVEEALDNQYPSLCGLVSQYHLILKQFRAMEARLDPRPQSGKDGYDLLRLVYSELKYVGQRILMDAKSSDTAREAITKHSTISYDAFRSCVEELEADEIALTTGHTEITAKASLERLFA